MKLIDNELGGTTPMDIIIKFNDSDHEPDDEFDELLGESSKSDESIGSLLKKLTK